MPVPDGADQSWAMDFVSDALVNGRRMRMLTVIDAWNRECPRIEVDFSLTGARVARVLEQLRQQGRRPQLIQVDKGQNSSARRSMPGRTSMASGCSSSGLESRWRMRTSRVSTADCAKNV
jgi:transposase InsO family protein